MNEVVLSGRLTKDPEIRATKDGTMVGNFTLAVDRRFKKDGQPEADFPRCIAWGKTADFAEKYLAKGTKIMIAGRLQTGSYEKDGRKVYTTDVIVDHIEFCEGKKEQQEEQPPEIPDDHFVDVPEGIQEELPFA